MRLRTAGATLMMTALLSGLPPSRVAAQARTSQTTSQAAPARPPEVVIDRQNASDTRERLRELLNEFPPALAQVLRLDPTLTSNSDYLAPYPSLAAFLRQHPEVARNPSFFLGDVRSEMNTRYQMVNQLEEIGIGIGVFLFFMTALGVVAHIGRGLLEHRRWLHAMKVQTEAHTKIVERLGSNEELMAYVQSPAGQRFLATTTQAADADVRGISAPAPVGRILGSAQIGVVTAFGGIGLWIAKNHVIDELAQPLSVLSVLGVALGLGFVLSAAVAYGMSKQLGLIRYPSSHA